MTGKSEKDMVIYLAGESQAAEPEPLPSFDELTPREIVIELDKYIVGKILPKKPLPLRCAIACGGRSSPLSSPKKFFPKIF